MHKRTLLSVLAAGVFCAGTPAYAGAATGAAAIARAAVLGNAHDLGRLPANAPVRLSIGLQLRNAAELANNMVPVSSSVKIPSLTPSTV